MMGCLWFLPGRTVQSAWLIMRFVSVDMSVIVAVEVLLGLRQDRSPDVPVALGLVFSFKGADNDGDAVTAGNEDAFDRDELLSVARLLLLVRTLRNEGSRIGW